MTLLYRSPNHRIDGHDWHVTVEQHARNRRTIVVYRWRVDARQKWRPLHEFPTRLPIGLREFFKPYQRSINVALASVGAPPRLREDDIRSGWYGRRKMAARAA